MQNDKLLPCPFCGGEAKVEEHKFWNEETKRFEVGTYGVMCRVCNCRTDRFYAFEEGAIAIWNTRKPMERIVEQLEESLQGAKDSKDLSKHSAYRQAIEIVKGGVDNAG